MKQNGFNPVVWIVVLGGGALILLLVAAGIGWVVLRRAAEDREREEVRRAEAVRTAEARAIEAAAERVKEKAEAEAAGSEREAEVKQLHARLSDLEAKLAQAQARIRELEAKPASEPPASPEPPRGKEERLKQVQQRLAELSEQGMFALGTEAFNQLVKELKELGPEGIRLLGDRLLRGGAAKDRFLAAAAMEGLLDPASVEYLVQSVKQESEMLVRRMASHALAVGQFPEGKDTLNQAMLQDADWGVRMNSAYGLAKMGDPRGVEEMVKWYESPTTEPQYKTAVLGGIADVGAPSTAPVFRAILQTSQDLSQLVLAIHGAEKTMDASLLPDLQRVMDMSKDEVVREAAEKAMRKLRGY